MMQVSRGLLLCCSVLLVACGWQLKGTQGNYQKLGAVYIAGEGFNESVVIKSVRADLNNSGVEITRNRSEADVVLWISGEESTLRTASYDVLVRAAENTMIMEVSYELRNGEGELISGPATVYAERLYEFDVQGVVSSAAQLSIIVRELQERLAEQIVGRLASVDPDAPPLPEPAHDDSHLTP